MKNEKEVQEFERLEQQLHSMLAEMGELSKKKANDGINKFKLKFINIILDELNAILDSKKPFDDFDKFDENDLPTNSDVVLMLSQYAAAVLRFRSENAAYRDGDWRWIINGKTSELRTRQPEYFRFSGELMPSQKDPTITSEQFSQYETLVPLVQSMHIDIRKLSRKNQNAPLSKARIAMINRLLGDVRTILQNEPTAAYLNILDEEMIPQNADALLVLGQFEAALDQFEAKYTYYDEDDEATYWRISDRRPRHSKRSE